MPYLTSAEKKAIDPKIRAITKYLFKSDQAPRADKYNAVLFWNFFLSTLYGALCAEIVKRNPDTGMRYRHYNALHGAFGCAVEELYCRWKDGFQQGRSNRIQFLAPVHSQRHDIAAQIHLKDSRPILIELTQRLAKSFSVDFISVAVGQVNYSISEIANAFGNSEIISHQDLISEFISVNHQLYCEHAYRYEKLAISKNGDTKGFLEFQQLMQVKARRYD